MLLCRRGVECQKHEKRARWLNSRLEQFLRTSSPSCTWELGRNAQPQASATSTEKNLHCNRFLGDSCLTSTRRSKERAGRDSLGGGGLIRGRWGYSDEAVTDQGPTVSVEGMSKLKERDCGLSGQSMGAGSQDIQGWHILNLVTSKQRGEKGPSLLNSIRQPSWH